MLLLDPCLPTPLSWHILFPCTLFRTADKFRQLLSNLKKNEDLRSRVNTGYVTADALVRMSVADLATQDKKDERKKLADHEHDARSLDCESLPPADSLHAYEE